MRYIIIGAGAIGGTVAGRLTEAGHDVVLVARGAHYEALRDHGLRVSTPDGARTHPLPTVQHPHELGELHPDDVLFLAVKTQDSQAALDDWSLRPVAGGGTAAQRLPLICAQNGVESERMALRRFRHVYGMCVWLPSTYVEPGAVSAAGAPYTGILHLGRYPSGVDETARAIAADLEMTKLLAPVVPDVMRWKYGKLLANLINAIEAVSGPVTSSAAIELLTRAQAEGRTVLKAAGIEAASEQEQAEARGDRIRFEAVEGAPRSGSSSWQSLARGTGTIEADYLNGEIALLGRLHGVPTPVNEGLRQVANAFAREQRQPGSMPVDEMTALLDALGRG
ncbi:2-dehydropantoate 2-reductase [Streptomyces sp. Je 1-332]|uniref:ketopantoate reductase family protein n=1 Tax=Streptomyces sp. Je 1-332 TaxID=3231270 RepID=UPI003457C951